jgi:hypothetical protein
VQHSRKEQHIYAFETQAKGTFSLYSTKPPSNNAKHNSFAPALKAAQKNKEMFHKIVITQVRFINIIFFSDFSLQILFTGICIKDTKNIIILFCPAP